MPNPDDLRRMSSEPMPETTCFIGSAHDRAARMELRERAAAEQEIAAEFADSHMPADIRQRARAWGMEAFITVLWSHAFLAGYRAGRRERPVPPRNQKP